MVFIDLSSVKSTPEMTGDIVELALFTAEAGRDYYLRTRFTALGGNAYLDASLIDSDQRWYLVTTFPQSVSQPKK